MGRRSMDPLKTSSRSSRCGSDKPVGAEQIVSQREPPQDGERFVQAADSEVPQVPLPQSCVDAFVLGAALVEGLAGFARHAFAPLSHAWAVILACHKGIGAMLRVRRWAQQFDALGVGPFDVIVLGKAAIGKVALRDDALPLQL